jgi:hypothetical protein
VYWLEIYALIAAAIFAVAGLCILMCFVWCEARLWLQLDTHPPTSPGLCSFSDLFCEPTIALVSQPDVQCPRIGISSAVSNALADGASAND